MGIRISQLDKSIKTNKGPGLVHLRNRKVGQTAQDLSAAAQEYQAIRAGWVFVRTLPVLY